MAAGSDLLDADRAAFPRSLFVSPIGRAYGALNIFLQYIPPDAEMAYCGPEYCRYVAF